MSSIKDILKVISKSKKQVETIEMDPDDPRVKEYAEKTIGESI